MILKQIIKPFNRYPETFQKYHSMASDIVSKIAAAEINTRILSDIGGGGVYKLTQSLWNNGPTCNLS